jgi:transcriptional regulator with XRE-family HTH domain
MEEAVRRKDDQEIWEHRSIPLPSLRGLRQSRGLTQRQLGELAQVAPGTVYRLENMLRGAYPSTMKKLSEALAVSPGELVRGAHRPEE